MYFMKRKFWEDAIERAVFTMAECAVALIGVDASMLCDLDFKATASACALAGLVSILKSLIKGYVETHDEEEQERAGISITHRETNSGQKCHIQSCLTVSSITDAVRRQWQTW